MSGLRGGPARVKNARWSAMSICRVRVEIVLGGRSHGRSTLFRPWLDHPMLSERPY
jgi:hypothetical protein